MNKKTSTNNVNSYPFSLLFDEFCHRIAALIRRFMQEHGLSFTYRDVAMETDLNKDSVSHIMNGRIAGFRLLVYLLAYLFRDTDPLLLFAFFYELAYEFLVCMAHAEELGSLMRGFHGLHCKVTDLEHALEVIKRNYFEKYLNDPRLSGFRA